MATCWLSCLWFIHLDQMRPALLLCLVLACAAPARAQAPDPVLIDSVVASMRLDMVESSITAGFRATALSVGVDPASERFTAGLSDALAGIDERLEGRIHGAIAADYRPELLRAVLAQNRVASQASIDSALAAAQDPTRIADLMRDLATLEADPTAFPLADSALAVRYLRSTGAFAPPSDADRQTLRTVIGRMPGTDDMLRSLGTTLDAFVDDMTQRAKAASAGRMVPTMRLLIARLTPAEQADFAEAVAFQESDAGAYLRRVVAEPTKTEIAAVVAAALNVLLPTP